MTRNQVITLSILGAVVCVLVLIGVFHQKNQLMGINEEGKNETAIPPREEAKTFGYS